MNEDTFFWIERNIGITSEERKREKGKKENESEQNDRNGKINTKIMFKRKSNEMKRKKVHERKKEKIGLIWK